MPAAATLPPVPPPAAPTQPQAGSSSGLFPPGWVETEPGRWQDPAGELAGELLAWDGASLDAVCQLEANRERPGRYGSSPEIRKPALGGRQACLVLPSADQSPEQSGRAAGLILLPPDRLLVMRGPAGQVEAAIGELDQAEALPTLTVAAESACDFSAWTGDPVTTLRAGLRVEEFAAARGEGCSPLNDPQGFAGRVQGGAAGEAAAQLEGRRFSPDRMEMLNAGLRPFGYRLETYAPGLVRVLKEGEVVRANLSWLGQLTLSRDGRRFLLPGLDAYNSVSVLLRPEGMQTFDSADLLLYDQVFPVLVGDAEVRLEYDTQTIPRAPGDPGLVRVLQDGQVVDTLAVSGSTPSGGPVRGLWAWQNHWLVELPGVIIENGTILNDALGCSEMFAWQLIGGEPFYFCRRGGRIEAWYAGQALPVRYDEVHYTPQVGMRMLVQMRRYETGLEFYARSGDTWSYVIVTADEDSGGTIE